MDMNDETTGVVVLEAGENHEAARLKQELRERRREIRVLVGECAELLARAMRAEKELRRLEVQPARRRAPVPSQTTGAISRRRMPRRLA